jgi:hypothetical protein
MSSYSKKRAKKNFESRFEKVSLLDLENSMDLFTSPKKIEQIDLDLSSPQKKPIRKTIVQKMKEYGY